MNVLHEIRVACRTMRAAARRRWKKFFETKPREPRIRIDVPPRFDDRNSIDRFRRESGTR